MKALSLALLVIALGVAGWAASACPSFSKPVPVGILQDGRIHEVSGIVASLLNPGAFWIHEDSGAPPEVYAVSLDGTLLALCTLSGITPIDCEDIAVGPGPKPNESYIYLADIGDNGMRRKTITIYRFPEPRIEPEATGETFQIGEVEKIDLIYPDRPHDAETLLVDPLSGGIYVITKWDSRSRIYRARLGEPGNAIRLEYVGDLPFSGATGGDVSPDGRWIIIRTYFFAYLWNRDPDLSIEMALRTDRCPVPLAREPQGEAICFVHDADSYVTISEGPHPVIYRATRRVSSMSHRLIPVRWCTSSRRGR